MWVYNQKFSSYSGGFAHVTTWGSTKLNQNHLTDSSLKQPRNYSPKISGTGISQVQLP